MRTETLQRIWLVICNNSVLGVVRTKREAEEATRLRNSMLELDCSVRGPFVYRGRR